MKVLIADDDCISCLALEAFLLRLGFEVEAVHDGQAALHALEASAAPRIAILDWMMPGLDGVDVCRRVRQAASPCYCYLFLLTARGAQQDVIDGLEAGADDYLIKPVDFHELKARIGAAQRILDLQDQLVASRDTLRDQALHDPLTRLWNHAAIIDTLSREWNHCRRKGVPLGVIMADIDRFKCVNDSHGHPVGDLVLAEVARRLCAALRPYDTIGRYGGEEFLVVLPERNLAESRAIAERLRETIAAKPISSSEKALHLSISLGVVASERLDVDPSGLIREADTALYEAKHQGRNRVAVAPESSACLQHTGEPGA